MDTEILISHTTVTLNKGQGHPNWYKNVEFSGLYSYTKLEKHGLVNVWIQANVNFFLTKSHKYGSLV